jgi:hypothetical protein
MVTMSRIVKALHTHTRVHHTHDSPSLSHSSHSPLLLSSPLSLLSLLILSSSHSSFNHLSSFQRAFH